MRKQTKWAVIIGAAAVMTLGATMTAYAAEGWVEEGGSWYYYDRFGDMVTDKWQKSTNGSYYFLGDDGAMLTSSWVETDGTHYYVNAHGARITSEWRKMIPEGDDSAEEESWFWFASTGKMATGKTTVNGKVYYLNDEGKMLTGWVNIDDQKMPVAQDSAIGGAKVVYTNESGQRVTSTWKELYAPEDEDKEVLDWYYFTATGTPYISTVKTINGKRYAFNNDGKMLTGWITASGSDYVAIGEGESVEDTSTLLYAGASNDGSIKRNQWINAVAPGENAEDFDESKKWYYTGSMGFLYYGDGELKVQQLEAGSTSSTAGKSAASVKKIGSKYYLFDEKGVMRSGLVILSGTDDTYKEGIYYFGKSSDGALKTGAITVTNDYDETFSYYFNATAANRGQGVSGIYSSKLYSNGALITAQEDSNYQPVTVKINGIDKCYLLSDTGRVITGSSTYTAENGAKYKVKLSADSPADKTLASYTVSMLVGKEYKELEASQYLPR